MGYLGFAKAQFLWFSAPAEPQGWVWRHCVGCESQVPRVALRFGLFPRGWALPTRGKSDQKKSWTGKRHEKKKQRNKKTSKMTEIPCKPTPPFLFSMVWSGCFGGWEICFHSRAGPPCRGGAELAPSPRALHPSGLRWLQPQARGLGWAGQSPGQAPRFTLPWPEPAPLSSQPEQL